MAETKRNFGREILIAASQSTAVNVRVYGTYEIKIHTQICQDM